VPASGSQVFPGFKPEDAVKQKKCYAAYGDLEPQPDKTIAGWRRRYEIMPKKDSAIIT